MDFSAEELLIIETRRVTDILTANEDGMTLHELQEAYQDKYSYELKHFQSEFTQLSSFLKYRCNADVSEDFVQAKMSQGLQKNPQSAVQVLSRPQFSQFHGFGEQNKGVEYRVWRYEVQSTINGSLYSEEVIAEQIRKSLQGEAKTKLIGFNPEAGAESLLEMLDQFYSDAESVTGDELLAEAYNLRQQDNEEVVAFASRLDNQVRLAKLRKCELLPDDNAVEKHLRILFWAGLRPGIKDKARHKKDQCKTFGELITAARYGEKEANNSTQAPKRVARSNPVQQVPQGTQDKKPSWVNEMCTSFSREVREVLKEGIQKKEVVNHIKPNEGQSNNANYIRYSEYLNEDGKPKERQPVRCYRCGQIGHIQVGCRNKPLPSRQGNEQRPPSRGGQRS